MNSFRCLSICLFVGCLVSVAQEATLIPYEHEELGLWGYRNPTTEEICIRPIFDEAGEFVGNIAPVKIGKRWGLIDRKGQMVVEPKFDEIGQFFESFFGGSVSKLVALVKDGDDVGFIHENGKMVNEYDDIGSLNEEGLALAKKDGKCGFIDQTGKEIIPLTLMIDFFNMVEVEKDGKWSVIDLMGKEVIPLIDHYGYLFLLRVNIGGKKNHYGRVAGGKWGVIDLTGAEIIPLIYDRVWNFNEQGLAMVKKDGKLGLNLVKKDGKLGLALVEKDGKLGLIDATGKEIIPLIYDDIGSFNKQRLAIAKKGGKRGVIDATGKEIIPLIYDGSIELKTLSEKLVRITVQIGEKWSDFVLYLPQPLTTQDLGVR